MATNSALTGQLESPILRIFVTPNGVLKVEGQGTTEDQRGQNYAFCERVLRAISNLDREVRQIASS